MNEQNMSSITNTTTTTIRDSLMRHIQQNVHAAIKPIQVSYFEHKNDSNNDLQITSGGFQSLESISSYFSMESFPQIPTPAFRTVSLLGLLLIIVVYYFYSTFECTRILYKTHFGGKRVARENPKSPSTTKLQHPDLQSWEGVKSQILDYVAKLSTSSSSRTSYSDPNQMVANLHSTEQKTSSKRLTTNNDAADDHRATTTEKKRASKLDMDHVYLSFTQLFWACTFIGPFSYFLWKKGTAMLRLRQFLVKNGILKKKPIDYEALVGKIVLEQSQVIHFSSRTQTLRTDKKEADDGSSTSIDRNIAGFFFTDFPYIDEESGNYMVANLLSVDIDLDTKKMVKCQMDGDDLTPSQALIVLWFNTISAQHVKLHALGNWGVNCEEAVRELNPVLYRSSVATVAYNFFGFTSFNTYMKEWKTQSLLSEGWKPQALKDVFNHGIGEGVVPHANVTELLPYSDFVKFVVSVRAIFHSEFRKYRHLFPGVECEALFTGTVLHSLDHALMEWNLEDPLWLDVDDPRFRKMAELGRIVRVGFVEDVPGYYFNRRFKNSGHPFYESIYKKAARINKHFADHMDTCICR